MRDVSLLVDLLVAIEIERRCFGAGKREQPTPERSYLTYCNDEPEYSQKIQIITTIQGKT